MVRIPGDEASILATIEVVKVLLIAATVSVLATLDNVWCMYMLRKHGEVIMYKNDIGHFASTSFRAIWHFLISLGWKRHTLEREKLDTLKIHCKLNGSGKERISRFSLYRSVRTFLLVFGIILSLAEIAALFALETEGKEVADKLEFGVRAQRAVVVESGSTMEFFNPHESQIRYEYVIRRLGQRMVFENGSSFEVQIPRMLDAVLDEKWPYSVRLPEKDVYATIYVRDFISEEKAKFSELAGQITGTTESGKELRHYPMARRDKVRNACSGSIGAVLVDGNMRSGTFCYTDDLRYNISCKDMKDGDTVPFQMRCSHIRLERFGEHSFENYIWWLQNYQDGEGGTGLESIRQMVSLRGYKRDDVSPSSMMIAAVLAEFPSQSVLIERDFAVDVGVVVVPNWLLISTCLVLGVVLLLGGLAAVYAATKNLVDLTNWQEMYITNLLEPLDCLNRSNRTEFRCVVSEGWDTDQNYQLFVEPRESISPASWVQRKEIGAFCPGREIEESKL